MPDHRDATLILELYRLRQEATLRASRAAVLKDFWPRSWDDYAAVLQPDHPLNAPYRQVTTYWEMAFSFVKSGILDGDLLLQNSAEGLFLFARAKPYLAELRATSSPRALRNAEWMADSTEFTRGVMSEMDARIRAKFGG
jgi:hypothetical protein